MKIPEMKVFVFSVEGFLFVKFYEKEPKPDIRKFKRGLVVLLDVQNWWNSGKIDFQFSKLTFSGVGDYLQICLNTSKIPKFQ